MPRKKFGTKLQLGEYEIHIPVTNGEGASAATIVKNIPKSDQPPLPITHVPLSEHLFPLFDGLIVQGRSGIEAIILLARMGAHRYDSLRKFALAWEDLHQQQLFPTEEFREPSLEQACDLAKLPYEDFVGDLCKAIYWYGLEAAKIRLQLQMNSVVDASIRQAVEGERHGFNDRQLLMKAGGLIQEGPGTVVNVNQQNVTNNLAMGLPQWEETDKVLTKALNGREVKALPEAPVIEAEIVEEECIREKLLPTE